MLTLGWPQLIWLVMFVCHIAYAVAHHGEPKKASKHSGPITIVGSLLGLGLLYWGGFFT